MVALVILDVRDVPTFRQPPPELARLIDSHEAGARLLYAGNGVWRLWRLTTSPTEYQLRRLKGMRLLDGMLALDGFRFGRGRDAARVLQATMFLRGYAWEWTYEVGAGEPNSSVADDFAVRLWNERRATEADTDRLIGIASGDDRLARRQAAMQEVIALEGPSAHRWVSKRPVSIINPLGKAKAS